MTGKVEGYDPINEMLEARQRRPGHPLRAFYHGRGLCFARRFSTAPKATAGALDFSLHALLATLLIHLSRYLNDWLILYDFDNNREVVGEKNIAVAIVEGATYLASAYVVGGTFYDWESGWWLAIVWFLIGQLLLIALGLLYRIFARGTAEALDRHNIAVGISLGGFLLAGGMVSGAVISGPSKGWQQDLTTVGIYVFCWLILMVLDPFHHGAVSVSLLPARR